jgi:hypothetical protein
MGDVMDLIESILKAQGGTAVNRLAAQFGLPEDQAAAAVQNILPALAGGFQRNISHGGLDNLLRALAKGGHQRYLDDPSTLGLESTRDDGNGILAHILGSKDVSRQVAARASAKTGVSESILKKMLPLVAAMAMGAMSRQTGGGRAPAGAPAAAGSGILGMLSPLLDKNRDGSVADDILGSVSGFFRK